MTVFLLGPLEERNSLFTISSTLKTSLDPIISSYGTLPETNMAHEMDGLKITFLWGRPIFRGYVSFTEGIYLYFVYLAFLLLVFSCCFGWISSSRWDSQCKPFRPHAHVPAGSQKGATSPGVGFYQPNGLFLYENWCKSENWFLQLKIVIKNSILSLFWRTKLRPLKQRLWEAKNGMSPFPPSMGSLSRGSLGQCISEIQNVQLRSWKWRFEDLSWI